MTASVIPRPRPAKSRLLIALVLDASGSMARSGAIHALNDALVGWADELRKDPEIRRIGRVAIVSFGHGGVRTMGSGHADPFVDVADFRPPRLNAELTDYSPMFEGVETGISLIRAERAALRRNGLALAFRPLLCLVTDGAPTDLNGGPTHRLPEVRERLRTEERDHNLVFSAIGVDGADHGTLRSLAEVGGYYKLARADFIQALTLITASADHVTTIGSDASAVDIHRTFRESVVRNAEMRDWLERGEGG